MLALHKTPTRVLESWYQQIHDEQHRSNACAKQHPASSSSTSNDSIALDFPAIRRHIAHMATRTKKKHRRSHLESIQHPAGMKAAAKASAKRRGSPKTHVYVVGNHELHAGEVKLVCVETNAPSTILENQCTTKAHNFARWRTKQAANQWLRRRPGLVNMHVYNLTCLDVLDPR